MRKVLFGVCSCCQSSYPVVVRDGRRLLVQEVDGRLVLEDHLEVTITPLAAPDFVMGPHMIGGERGIRCDGEGTPPQATFSKDLTEEEFLKHKTFFEEPADDTVGYAGEGDWVVVADENGITGLYGGDADWSDESELEDIEANCSDWYPSFEDNPKEPDPEDWQAQVRLYRGKLDSPNRCRRVVMA